MRAAGEIINTNLTFPFYYSKVHVMKIDIHVHTTLSSCSQLTLDNILAQAPSNGLDGVCITDHDTMAVRHHISEGIQSNGLCVLFGMEYTTSEGDFLLFGPYEELIRGLPAPILLRYVENTGGVAVAAHPFRVNRPTSEYLVRKKMCRIVEGVNGRNSIVENEAVLTWHSRYNVSQVGGSDAHSLAELGQVPTSFSAPVTCRSAFIQALKQGDYQQVVPQALSRQVA